MLIVCDPEATPYKYLASIGIKATAATIRNPKPQYAIRIGAFMLGGPSRDEMPASPGLMHAKVWPRTDL